MSRIGKKPIEIPEGIKIEQNDSLLTVTGPKGSLSGKVPDGVKVALDGNAVSVERLSDDKRGRSLHGLTRALVSNMVTGVSEGFQKSLKIVGVGYRGEVDGDVLRLFIGYSAPVEYKVVEGISIKVDKQVDLTVSGIDRELVGRVAAEIRGFKKPEPYKEKGIRYADEKIRKKVGKSAGA